MLTIHFMCLKPPFLITPYHIRNDIPNKISRSPAPHCKITYSFMKLTKYKAVNFTSLPSLPWILSECSSRWLLPNYPYHCFAFCIRFLCSTHLQDKMKAYSLFICINFTAFTGTLLLN